MSATEVSREFSSIVNRVSGGEEIEVTRNGVPVMVLSPVASRQRISPDRWRELMASLPPVDDDFARDVEAASREIWPSPGP